MRKTEGGRTLTLCYNLSMSDYYFVRHGESVANVDAVSAGWSDVPLTSKGRQQAKQVGNQIKRVGLNFDMIISSPLSRALDTAKAIARVNDFPEDAIVIVPELREKSSGSLELGPLQDIFAKTEEQLVGLGGESAQVFQERVERAQRIIHRESRGRDTVLIVAHPGIYKMLEVISDGLVPATKMYEIKIPKNAGLLKISM